MPAPRFRFRLSGALRRHGSGPLRRASDLLDGMYRRIDRTLEDLPGPDGGGAPPHAEDRSRPDG